MKYNGNPTAITDVWAGGNGANGSSQQTGSDGWQPTIVDFTTETTTYYYPPVNFGGGGSAGSGIDQYNGYLTAPAGGLGGGGGYSGTPTNWPNGITNLQNINNFVNGINYAKTDLATGGLYGSGGGGAG